MFYDFYHTFQPCIQVAHNGGIYIPKSRKIYKSFGGIIKILVHVNLFLAITDITVFLIGIILFLSSEEEGEGATRYYMVVGLGTLVPSFIRVAYAQVRCQALKELIDIWQNDLNNPPIPDNRNAEIQRVRKYLSSVTRIMVNCFIIPLTLLTARPFVTKQKVIPIGFPGNYYGSPVFELISAFIALTAYYVSSVWSGFEILQMVFMHILLAELNHLNLAIDKIFSTITGHNHKGSHKGIIEKIHNTKPTRIDEVRKILRTWIIHHQALLRFSIKINQFFWPMILLPNVCTISFSFLTLYVVTIGDMPFGNRVESISYLVFYYYILFHNCSLGDEIQLKSMNIMECFFEKEWYFYPKDIIKSVLIIQNVTANRPINLTAHGLLKLNRRTFGRIIHKGYEAFTFMAHIMRRNQL